MRLDELQAAFLRVKLKRLKEWTSERVRIASWDNSELQGGGDLVLPEIAEGATHVYHLYVIRTKKRDALQQYLADHGVGTIIHYPIPFHLQGAYAGMGYKIGDFPIAEEIADTVLSLPLWPGMAQQDVSRVSKTIYSFFKG